MMFLIILRWGFSVKQIKTRWLGLSDIWSWFLCLENVMFVKDACHCLTLMWHSSVLYYHGAGQLLDQISIVKSSSWSEGVSRWISPHLLSCSQIIFRDEIKHCQSKPGSFLPKLTEKSNKPLRWLNCCFKQTIFFVRLSPSDQWQISFDVYQPDTVAEFKKSHPGKPYSRMCVCR